MTDLVGKSTLEIMNKATLYNKWLLKNISDYIKGNIFEVGAGIGTFTKEFVKLGNVWAGDFNPDYIKLLKSILGDSRAGFTDIEKGNYFFKGSQKFDTIICMNVLEHIKDDRRALKNMYNLLNKNGSLILLVPAHSWAYGPIDEKLGHYRRYSTQDIKSLFPETGFKVIGNKYLNWVGIWGWFVNAKILRKNIIPEGQLGIFDKLLTPFLFIETLIHPPFGLSVFSVGKKT